MIAADTSTWIAYFQGDDGPDTAMLDLALDKKQVLMVPAVLAEILSDPMLPRDVGALIEGLPLTETGSGYWRRAGLLRAVVLAKGRKARLGDALIAQSCLDRDIRLITRDRDFKAFNGAAGLKLLVER